MQDDQKDYLLLRNHPFQLLLNYQKVFRIITRRYARNGYFSYDECDEILQHINEKLFSRIEIIMEQYDGRVLVRTYLSAICRNIIKEYIRTVRRRKRLLMENVVMEQEYFFPGNMEMLFREECRRLDRIMVLLGKNKAKMWLLMKLTFRIRMDMNDFLAVSVSAGKVIGEDVIRRLNNDVTLRDKDLYLLTFPLFQLTGPRISNPDTLRKWFKQKLSEVIALMNGLPQRAYYTEETMQILVEKYCSMTETGTYSPLHDCKYSQAEIKHCYDIIKSVRKKSN